MFCKTEAVNLGNILCLSYGLPRFKFKRDEDKKKLSTFQIKIYFKTCHSV